MDSPGLAQRRPRVDRREAARILQCSRDNIRRLDKNGTLRSGRRDLNGAFTYDRREIEKLAHERGQRVKPNGELAARVFAMFKARKRFEDIVIETEQEPPAILALWRYYKGGFEFDGAAPDCVFRRDLSTHSGGT
jgi:hypothetical protein